MGFSAIALRAASRSVRSFPQRRLMSSLPYHLVVGLPALSPTMESGSLAEWYVAEGDSFGAGDALVKIETDKASIDFEAQDDGYVAKFLADTGVDLPIGAPIMVTVEEEEDVAAFKNFVAPAAEAPAAVEPKEEAAPAPPAPEPVVEVAAPVAQAPPAPAAVEAPAAVAATASEGSVAAVAWGQSVVTASPLAKTLAAAQNSYLSKYGTTGQRPIL